MIEVYEFYTGHACKFLDISRRTIYRWLKSGKINSTRDFSNNHKFTLTEINRVRELHGMTSLTREQAYKLWEELYSTNE